MKRVLSLALLLSQTLLGNAITLTPLEKPEVPDSLMHVSVYEHVQLKANDLPIKMVGADVDFVSEYKINPRASENISSKLQQAIDKYSAMGGAKIHIKRGDYQIGDVQLRSNIHLLFEAGTIVRPYSDILATATVFSVGKDKDADGTKPAVRNVSIQGVGGRFDVLLAPEMNNFNTKFVFIATSLVEDFVYANFNVYDHKTTHPSLGFSAAKPNDDNYIGATNGVIMNLTCIDSHYGYGLIQAQAGRNLRFYNLHGIGGITLRFETGSTSMNKTQFGGVWDIEGQNISVANGHGAVLCGPHGMKNGVVHIKDVTAFSSGTGFAMGETDPATAKDKKGAGNAGSFGAGSSIYNVTAIFGFNAQIKTKELGDIPTEYIDMIGQPGTAGIIENAPAHTCVRLATSVPIDYDVNTFKAIGYKYGNPIRIADGKITNAEQQRKNADYIKAKYADAPKPAPKGGRRGGAAADKGATKAEIKAKRAAKSK